jgi:hypothetical protein
MTKTKPSSTDQYWADFEVSDDDIDIIYNLLLEREGPLTTEEMALAVIDFRLERQKLEEQMNEDNSRPLYVPEASYENGQEIVFPAFENRIAKVMEVRKGQNPDYPAFDVITVRFKDNGDQKEFAARLKDHALNQPPEPPPHEQQIDSAEEIYSHYQKTIFERLSQRLKQTEEIVQIAGRWFPKALLADVNEGHLNLAEAVLDVSEGGPLPTQTLMEPLELPGNVDPLLGEFSMDYALQEDERFDEVGPAGEVLWFLKRLEPSSVLSTPERLVYDPLPCDRSNLNEDLLHLEGSLDDELIPSEEIEEAEEVTLSILFPHWRVGALPLSNRLRPLFPTAYESPRIRFILVDGHTGEEFPGWVVRKNGYVLGLGEWYLKHDVPAGGLVRVRKGEEKGKVVVEAIDARQRNDWVRTVTVDGSNQIGFTMLKQAVGTAYDDLMVVGLLDDATFDEAWLSGQQRNLPIDRLCTYVFKELAKLNPQTAVHAQFLYSGINVIQRVPPCVVFDELMSQPYYVHVGDLYWRFEESMWSRS